MYFLLVLNFATVIYVLSINVKLLKKIRKLKKIIALVGKTTTLHVQLTFLYISLPFLHDLRVMLPGTIRNDDF